jgi:hypothetical protein
MAAFRLISSSMFGHGIKIPFKTERGDTRHVP